MISTFKIASNTSTSGVLDNINSNYTTTFVVIVKEYVEFQCQTLYSTTNKIICVVLLIVIVHINVFCFNAILHAFDHDQLFAKLHIILYILHRYVMFILILFFSLHCY